MALRDWVKLPSSWIEAKGLQKLKWSKDGVGSANTAALMCLTAVAHHADADSGIAQITYDQLCAVTGLSRAKVSDGLDVLADLDVITRKQGGRSALGLANYDPTQAWAMIPAKKLYAGGRIMAFDTFKLRNPHELNAMKLYFLFAARRGRDTNMANISLDKIEDYVEIDRSRIKPATSLLCAAGLIYVEHFASRKSEHGIANAYRLVGLHPKSHMGTVGRGMDTIDFDNATVPSQDLPW